MARGDDLVLKISADTSSVANGLKPMTSALDAMGKEADDAGDAMQRLEKDMEAVSHETVDVDVRTQALDKARADVKRLRDEIAQGVLFDVDTRAAERQLSQLQTTIKRVLTVEPVTIDVDTGDSQADVERLDASMDGIQDKRVELDVKVDREGLRGVEGLREGVNETANSLSGLQNGMSGVFGVGMALVPALADLSETLDDYADRAEGAGRSTGRFFRAASGVTSFIAGPWGLAIAGGVALLTMFAQGQQEADEQTKALAESIKLQAGAFDENNRQQAAKLLQDKGALDAAEQLGVRTSDLVTALLEQRDAQSAVGQSQDAIIAQMIRSAGGRGDEVVAINDLESAYNDAAEAIGGTAEDQRQLETAVGATTEMTKNQKPAVDDATTGWQGYDEAITSARTELDKLIAGLNIFNGRFASTREATAAYEESVDAATKAIKENKKTLDLSTEAGRTNDKLVRDMATNISSLAEARIRDADASGESTTDILDDYGKQRESLIQTADKLGMSRKEAEKYVDQLLATPDEVKTKATVTGVDAAENELKGLTKDRKVEIEAQLTLNRDKYNALPKRLQDAISGNGDINVNVNSRTSATPSAAPTMFSPRLYLDSAPIRYALHGDVTTEVSAAISAANTPRRTR
jgi:hypothetical protein